MLSMKTSHLISFALLILGLGLWGTWFFSTLETLSRTLRDISSMAVLIASLLAAGVFIVQALAKLAKS
mgnify:CR=1 FL=1